jgi:OCT family organic cation transporter-like MFS transporter 4/5
MIYFSPGVEFVGPPERRFAGFLDSFFALFGRVALTGMAFYIRDWKTLLIVASLPGILYLPFWLYENSLLCFIIFII